MPDINVWVALASDRHVHHRSAGEWFAAIEDAHAAFCRVTQMGFLRLLTNSRVMGGDVLAQREAWGAYEELLSDSRVIFVPEPPEIEPAWKKLTQKAYGTAGLWTDAYIAALALLYSFQVVSFDKGFRKIAGLDAAILAAS